MQPTNPQYPGAAAPGTPMQQPQYPAPGAAMPGAVPDQSYPVAGYPGQSYPGQSYPAAGYPGQGYPPGYGPAPQRAPLDLARIGAAVVAFCGLIVLFASLASLYHIQVTPAAAPNAASDIESGTVDVKMGFFSVAPFNAPIIALAIPMLMLVAALTAVPVLLGRKGQAALVSAVSSCAAVLLGIVLMFSNPLPSVKLTGEIASEFAEETGTSLDKYVDTVVSISPGAGLIISVVFGLVGAAGAVLAYLKTETAANQ